MFLEVTAVPDADSPARLGERFTPRPGAPLRLGPGRQARIRLRGQGGDLVVAAEGAGLVLRVPSSSVCASLGGAVLTEGSELALRDGDTLYLHPGLALCVRERPLVRAREHHLEARLGAVDDEVAWEVYADFLEEAGDPLASWLRTGGAADEAQRRRQLGPLADAVRGGLVEVSFNPRGLLASAHLTRPAVVGAPGLGWHLSQLATLPVARFLRELGVALFAGAAPARVDDDTAATAVLERVAGADFAPALRRLGLGFVQEERAWPRARAAFERLRGRASRLEHGFEGVVRTQGKATLVLVSHGALVTALHARVALNPSRTDVGGAAGCLVRLVGDVPAVVCTLHRLTDGGWVVYDERADPFSRNRDALTLKVNGVAVSRAPLSPGDTLEPLPGLTFRFEAG
ncbi:MAG: hypothetical protein IT380_21235 [Myxococcales bacterium]|nr:hypothetical protein [Myxococcales bacterium]